MLFSSLTFIFYFLPFCVLLYYIIPRKHIKARNAVLLIFSLIFYSWGEPKHILLMISTILFSYLAGLAIEYCNKKGKIKIKKFVFICSILMIIGSLIYFKYTNFFLNNINTLFKTKKEINEIILPIGISFYTFQVLSYIIDLYNGKIKLQKSVFNLALYISFFPQLIAGPIVRYETIEKQLENRKENLIDFVAGLERFIIGLSKKLIIANNMALIADTIFNNSLNYSYSVGIIILGTLSYTFQIYYDFSGYSDMAIGLGKMFGFNFLENFNYPYMSLSISDFWNRWHISLTTFFREYLYIPLGGNRVSKKRWILNMTIVWILTGFWHGAAWTFILWGLYYLVILLIERTLLNKYLDKFPKLIRFVLTFIVINFGWLIFRVESLNNLFNILKMPFQNQNYGIKDCLSEFPEIIPCLPFLVIAFIFSFDIMKRIENKLSENLTYNIFKKISLLVAFVLSIALLVSTNYNPFIYFRF